MMASVFGINLSMVWLQGEPELEIVFCVLILFIPLQTMLYEQSSERLRHDNFNKYS